MGNYISKKDLRAIELLELLDNKRPLEEVNHLLTKSININYENQKKQNALFLSGYDLEITKALINKGIDVHKRDVFGNTALFYSKDINVTMLLVFVMKQSTSVVNNKGENILYYITLGDNDLESCIQHGLNIKDPSHVNRCIPYNNLKSLLDKGMDVKNKGYPLCLYMIEGDVNSVELLLKSGSDPNKLDNYLAYQHRDCVFLALKYGMLINESSLFFIKKHLDIEFVEQLIYASPDIIDNIGAHVYKMFNDINEKAFNYYVTNHTKPIPIYLTFCLNEKRTSLLVKKQK